MKALLRLSSALVTLLPLVAVASVVNLSTMNNRFAQQTLYYYYDVDPIEPNGTIWHAKLTEATSKWTYSDPASMWGKRTIREAVEDGIAILRGANPGLRFVEIPASKAELYPKAIKFIKQTEDKVTCFASSREEGDGRRKVIGTNRFCHAGIVAHEIMHHLGIRHEQQRPDRDTYACVYTGNDYLADSPAAFTLPDNLQRGHSNFRLRSKTRLLGEYDFDSIMHYSDSIMKKQPPESEAAYPKVTLGKRLHPGPLTSIEDCLPGTGIAYWEEDTGNGRSYHGQRYRLSSIDAWSLRQIYFHTYEPESGPDFNGDDVADLVTQTFDQRGRPAVTTLYGARFTSESWGLRGENLPLREVSFRPEQTSRRSTYGSVITSGDFNGDFRMDIAIGSAGDNKRERRVHIVYSAQDNPSGQGEIGLQSRPRLEGEIESHWLARQDLPGFGKALLSADFNGDGYSDLITATDTSVLFYPGTPEGLDDRTPTIVPFPAMNLSSVVEVLSLAAGDFNGDGISDLVVGDPRANNDQGLIAILEGGETGPQTHATVISQGLGKLPAQPSNNNRFGDALAVGDLNNDGYSDLVVSSPMADITHDGAFVTDAGYVTVIYAEAGVGIDPMNSRSVGFTQNEFGSLGAEGSVFGYAVAVADLNGDGYGDLIASAPGRVKNNRQGEVLIIYSDSNGANPRSYEWETIEEGCGDCDASKAMFGQTLSHGDYDGNGFVDLAIGAPGADNGMIILRYNGSRYSTSETFQGRSFPVRRGIIPASFGAEAVERLPAILP